MSLTLELWTLNLWTLELWILERSTLELWTLELWTLELWILPGAGGGLLLLLLLLCPPSTTVFRTPSLGVPAPQERSTSLFNSTTLFSTASPCACPPREVNLFHRVACLPPNPCPPSGEVNLSCHLHRFVSTGKPNMFCHTHQPTNQSISQLINQSQQNNGIITIMTNTTKPRNHATTNQRANVASRPANHEKATTSKQSTNPAGSCNVRALGTSAHVAGEKRLTAA